MKRLQVLFLVTLSFFVVVTGCGKKDTQETIIQPIVEPITEIQPEEPEEGTGETDDEQPPEEGMVRNPLSNEWIDGSLEDVRPIAVMSPNDSNALPHYNFSKADILYECPVEGGITRSMAVFKDWENLDRIGNVRSSRDYFVYWALEWDAIYVHFGGPFYIQTIIEMETTDNITGCAYGTSTGNNGRDGLYENTFFRASDRNAPQNAYASAEGINKAIEKLEYSKTYREDLHVSDHFKFASSREPNTLDKYSDAIDAGEISLAKAYPINKTAFSYSEEDGLYYRSMYGKADVDAANNQQLAFKNVLVQFAYHEIRDQKGYLSFQCHDTTRGGYYFTNGKCIPVTWEKHSDYEPTKFYDSEGNEIQLNTGKTMICIVNDGDTIDVDGSALK